MTARPRESGWRRLGAAFLVTATVAFLGMRWNMLEPRWAFPMGTKVMLVAAGVVAALSRALARTSPKTTVLTVGAAIPAGAFASVATGLFGDPISQSLWPVGIVALAVLALAASSLGTLLGSLALRLFRGAGR